MSDMSEFYEVFFEECFEGLEVMESGLLALQPGSTDMEEINTIFRAAHSIKGGSATFDFNDIASFTHVMETLLDQMRSGEREVTTPDIDLLLESVDCLSEMINATRDEEALDEARIADLKKRLEDALENPAGADSGDVSDEAKGDSSAAGKEEDDSVGPGWKIRFVPGVNAIEEGLDPLAIFEALSDLGDLKVACGADSVPEVDNLKPEQLYLSWNATLRGDVKLQRIKDVFGWLDGDSKVEIEPLEPSADEGKSAEAAQAPEEQTKSETAPQAEKVVPISSAETTPKKEPEKASGKPAKPKKSSGKSEGSIRVSISKIDALINLVGELVITQSMLGQFGENFDLSQIDVLRDGLNELERNSRELQQTAMQIRMLPISTSFNRFPRLVRDLSNKLGKKVELQIIGENTEIDKTVLEKIGDPLVHLVRNSLDHGLETPEVRRAAGKPEVGVLKLEAYHEGGNIVIDVIDDGAGLNKQKILGKAIERGIVSPDKKLDDDEINNLIFQPGFSTAEVVSDVSGRGVGMDVVRRNIEDLGGHVYIMSEEGKGSTLRITLPLTLAIIDGQLVRVGDCQYVIPMLVIDESLQVDPRMVKRYKGQADLYRLRDEYIPILRLKEAFNLETGGDNLDEGLLVVVETERRRIGLFVDELMSQQQVVIKSIERNFRKVNGFSGATILGDGTVALIIDAAGLVREHFGVGGKVNIPQVDAA